MCLAVPHRIEELCGDGSAIGDDGRTYYAVSRDDPAGDCEVLGYSCEIDAPIDETTDFPWTIE